MNRKFDSLGVGCRFGAFVCCLVLFAMPGIAAEPQSVPFHGGAKLIFATPEQGEKQITKQDGFIEHVGELEMQVRMESAEPVSKEAYLKSLGAGVKAWKPEEIEIVEKAAKQVAEALEGYDFPLPEEVLLVRVSAEVEGDAPHCRGASVILPDGFFSVTTDPARILAHELFHVMSSHHPELRDKLYEVIHFTKCNEVELPESVKPQRVTNPDAYWNQHVVRIDVAGQETPVMPVILTRSAEYQPGGLFANLDFRLMVLEEADGKFAPKLVDGEAVLLSPREAADYLQKIGRNTGYIIHPEEVLADNFALMLFDPEGVRDAWVIEGMQEVLKK
ncbi:hypothetical protein [Blastopirellula marina]|uniref:DUF4157 domain-containing protein n=1 Tax=Blastopirellula marina TaxID=124 RepID=A0A2S8GCT9_9BACT|nr:hypothetical protein [Blastopirellula marina]PQO42081.1 hypothetical protein C5Y93_27410 [Blastopirellula marina]